MVAFGWKWLKWLKMVTIVRTLYLKNGWSYEDDWPLNLIARPTFLLVFHIMYAHQSNRNGWNSHFGWKRLKSVISHISWTSGHMKIVDPLFWSQEYLLFQYLFCRVSLSAKLLAETAVLARKGLKGQKPISHKPLVIGRWLTPHFNHKTHFSISVSYNVYLLDQQKWLKLAFCTKMAEKT